VVMPKSHTDKARRRDRGMQNVVRHRIEPQVVPRKNNKHEREQS